MGHAFRRAFLLLVAVAAGGVAMSAPQATAGGVCGDLEEIVVAGVVTCTHGGDQPVLEVVGVPGSRTSPVRATPPPAPCPGNGRSGRRVRILLGYPSDTARPVTTDARPLIKQAVTMADGNLDARSPKAVGQHYRFWCRHDRRVTISVVALAPIGADGAYTFNEVASSLATAGYDHRQSVYAVFVANIECCYPYGGQGSLAVDDEPDPDTNANNGAYPRYSMIRFNTGSAASSLARVFQHETGHNLGAVQNSAPHATGGFHCYETLDVMCYNDGGSYFSGGGELVPDCPDAMADGQYIFDCKGDDYYNIAPGHGTYLATHWNLADSHWLTAVGNSGR